MKYRLLAILLLLCQVTIAQMDITFPSNRAVFQRNNSNQALIHIAGNYKSSTVERIEAQLTPINGGQQVKWTTISPNPVNGIYRGAISAFGGWYKLEVRAIHNSIVVETATVDRVGVGEVFIIAGQSNAQGYNNFGQPAAQDDRVSCITKFYSFGNEDSFPYPEFTQLSAEEKLAPTGNGSWCWGRLGDMLATKLNVPILFINAAWEAMAVGDYKISAEGKSAVNVFSGNVTTPGYPYNSLKHSLHFYTSMLGIRAILWHQGETDNWIKTTEKDYYDNLTYIIKKTRTDIGKDVSWVICRASKIAGNDYSPVINAQNQVIIDMANVFAGPNTDLNNHRVDGTHFSSEGLTELGNSWNESLDNNFFTKSTPTLGNFLIPISIFCNGEGDKPLKLNLPSGYISYFWSTRENTQSIFAGTGSFYGYGRDNVGNVYYSQRVVFPNNVKSDLPTIEVSGSANLCEGDIITLKSSYPERNYWSTGATTQTIQITKGGTYSVTHVNTYGCVGVSKETQIKTKPLPTATIALSGAESICNGQSLTLTSGSDNGNIWTTGETTKSITVNKAGDYSVKVSNEFGCTAISRVIKVNILSVPEKPKVTLDGKNVFCFGDSSKLKTESNLSFQWNTGSRDKEIFVKNTGIYFGINKNSFGCESRSDTIKILANPLPESPQIIANKNTIYCGNNDIILKASARDSIFWNTGYKGDTLSLSANGIYTAKSVDKNGCISIASNPIKVFIQPNPPTPRVQSVGHYTLDGGITITEKNTSIKYEWDLEGERLIGLDSSVIKARKNGNYTSKAKVSYYYNDNKDTLTCESAVSDKYQFIADLTDYGIVLFPNPVFDSNLNIESFDLLENVTLLFYDVNSELKKTVKVNKLDIKKNIDVADLPKGVYFITIISDHIHLGKKIIFD